MRKIILSVFILSVFLINISSVLAEEKLWSDGDYEYKVQREGNNIALTSTVPKIPRIAGIPNIVGTITGTTFSGKVYLVADDCPNLDGYVPANGTVSKDGNSLTVTYNTTDFYYTTCVEKANSESEVTKTYSIATPSPAQTITNVPVSGYGISNILGFNNELLQLEKIQEGIDKCPLPRIPSENSCVKEALSQLGLPTYLKDINIEPDFTNTIVLDDSKVQIISFPEGTKDASNYPMNSISTNLTDFSKDFEIVADDSGKLPILNLSPNYPSEINPQDQSYTIVESSGVASVGTASVSEPGSNYSGNWESLVTLDKDAVSSPVIIKATGLVLDSNAQVTLSNSSNQSVMEISDGAKVVVAGWAAEDTLEAAQEFVSQLKNLGGE